MLEKLEEEYNPEQVIEEFEYLTKNAERIQIETLERILEENKEAEYLKKLSLNGKTDPETFKACVPIVSHEDLEPYIQRIVDGEIAPILTGKPVTRISVSSGTTKGRRKHVPFTDELMKTTVQVYRTSFAFRNREFPIDDGKALQFIYSSKPSKTSSGIDLGTATTHIFRDSQFRTTMKAIQSPSCSPPEVIFGLDFHQSLYCHLLCGLIYREEIQFVFSTFAHSIIHAFQTFEQVWEQLCEDIGFGVLTNMVTDLSIRVAMSEILRPNPEMADEIREKCSGLSNWYGLIPALFPNIKYVYCIMTGSMELYVNKLRHYAGDLPLLNADYGASEGWIGPNVNPKTPPESSAYVVLPNIGYFEFIPLRESSEDGEVDRNGNLEPVGFSEVKIGEEYEILLTNFTGMYRYELGDVVKVVGFHNAAPEVQFVCRRNTLLSINIDKTTEKDLQVTMEAATKLLANEKLELVDFTSCVDSSTDPGHYVIFWEINGEASDDVLSECCSCLDLSFADMGYVTSRKVHLIGALELRVVKHGTFEKLLEHFVRSGGVANQFKTPRCLAALNRMSMEILSSNVVKNYFSTAYD